MVPKKGFGIKIIGQGIGEGAGKLYVTDEGKGGGGKKKQTKTIKEVSGAEWLDAVCFADNFLIFHIADRAGKNVF